MKTKKQPKEKQFDTVKTFRAIKEKIAHDIIDMDVHQIKAYLKKRKLA